MPKVEQDANLHEDSVINAATHAATYSRRRARGVSKSSRVTSMVVNSEVWRIALHLAGGDRHRLRVISPTEVRVENSRG